MNESPDALLLLSSHCPHCPAVLSALAELVKRGAIGRLEVVNIDRHPDRAAALGVRSVPWMRIGPFELAGVRSLGELEIWAGRASEPGTMADAFHDLLKQGGLRQVSALVAAQPTRLQDLLGIVANPEASINVKLGVGAIFEDYAGTPALSALLTELGMLARHADARVRADACHYLGLVRSPAARDRLQTCLDDADAEVREIAQDSLRDIETFSASGAPPCAN